jgi:hypothetical protein
MKRLYSNFLSEKPADISIELEVVERLSAAEVVTALAQTRIVSEGNRFVATELTFEAEFNATSRILSLTVDKCLFDPSLEFKLMNRLFPEVYYAACGPKYGGKPPAMLVHTCGILRCGEAMLFAGPCETGKTTIARLCGDQDGRVINDEMLLVSRPHQADGSLIAQGVPVIGEVTQRLNEAAPIRCVLLLKQSKRTVVRQLDRMEAYLRFMKQVIPPGHLGHMDGRTSLSLIAEFSDEVTGVNPFYELEFTLDKKHLWEVVAELEQSLTRGVCPK